MPDGSVLMRIDLSCAACGGNNFSLDEAEADDSQIFCRDCGHEVGTLGQVKGRVVDAIRHNEGRGAEVAV
jgi:DNA-directed RNA polymerase subunit RPC12/RpoP